MDRTQIAKWTLIAVIALGVAACGAESGAQTPLMEKIDGDTYRLKVGETSLIVQGRYITGYSGPSNLSLLAYWPGLGSDAESGMTATDHVRISLQPLTPEARQVDYDQLAATRIRRLVGLQRRDDLDATVYTDGEGNINELHADHETPTGTSFWISCTRFRGPEDTSRWCRVVYPINETLRLQYRYRFKHLPDWRTLDLSVREFALSLIEEA